MRDGGSSGQGDAAGSRLSKAFDFAPFGQQGAGHWLEAMLEQYRYARGAALVELEADEIAKLGEVFRGASGVVQDVVGKVQGVVDKAQATAGNVGGGVAPRALFHDISWAWYWEMVLPPPDSVS